MADITVTAADVGLADTGVVTQTVQVAVAVTQGQVGYLDTTESKYRLADADLSSAAASAAGIFLTPAAIDGYAVIAMSGPVDVGATLTVGETYVASGTAGGIAPIADLATGDYVTLLGIATAAGKLQLDISASGAQVP